MRNRALPALVVVLVSSFAFAQDDKSEAWKSDIEYLKTELPKRHKNLFSQVDRNVFEDRLDGLCEDLPRLSETEVVLSLQEIIAGMGDAHTAVDYGPLVQKGGIFPLTLYWFSDGLHVMGTLDEYKALLAGRITAINNVPVAEVTARVSGLLAKTNDALVRHRLPNILPSIAVLRHFAIIEGDSASFDFVDPEGARKSLLLHKWDLHAAGPDTRFVGFTPKSHPLYWQNQRSLFWSRFLEEGGILYAQYNRCWGRELEEKHGSSERAERLPSFTSFAAEVLAGLKKPETLKFVLDLRFNPGGSSPQGTELAREVGKIAAINRKGRIFVIVGKRTYSSAVINAIDLQRHTEAILFGEPTSGKPNHFGEVQQFALPQSRLNVSYSTKYFKYSDGDTDSLMPDVVVETSFEDFAEGRDPVLEAIRRYEVK